MALLSFIGIGALFLLTIIVSVVMYFKSDDDIWFQILWAITAFGTFIILVPFSFQTSNFVMGTPTDTDTISLQDFNINNFNFATGENVTNNSLIHISEFNINSKDESLIKSAEFCFYYNNTDDSNILIVASLDSCYASGISQPAYIINNSAGLKCIKINETSIFDTSLIGILCDDCNMTNTIILERVNATFGEEILVNEDDINDYTIFNDNVHSYYINLDLLGKEQINDWFFRYLWFLGFLALGFGLRGIVIVILAQNEVILK